METSNVSEQDKVLEQVLYSISELEQLLLEDSPDLTDALLKINRDLRQYPELVHLLPDEQIVPFYKALMQRANVQIKNTKSRAKGKKATTLPNGKEFKDLL